MMSDLKKLPGLLGDLGIGQRPATPPQEWLEDRGITSVLSVWPDSPNSLFGLEDYYMGYDNIAHGWLATDGRVTVSEKREPMPMGSCCHFRKKEVQVEGATWTIHHRSESRHGFARQPTPHFYEGGDLYWEGAVDPAELPIPTLEEMRKGVEGVTFITS